jgi:hypothetical protein
MNYLQVYSDWLQGKHDGLSPVQRRVLPLIVNGEASVTQLEEAGEDFVVGIKIAANFGERTCVADAIKVEGRPNTLTFRFSDETTDRMGDIIRQDGWKLDNYKRNPVILWGHAHGMGEDADEPIGRGLNLRIDGMGREKSLVGDVEFAVEESERAARKYRLAAAGYVKANSVGFQRGKVNRPESKEERESLGLGPAGVVFESGHELLEDSLCAIPANPSALQASIKSGLILEADADELVAATTEREREKYLRRRARSFVSMAVPLATTTETITLADNSVDYVVDLRADPRTDVVLAVVKANTDAQRALADALNEHAARSRELAKAIADLGGRVGAAQRAADAEVRPDAKDRTDEILRAIRDTKTNTRH